ncbi:MAG: aminotransferase class III-fold pyridoxal phosphate-dependent enzyme [Bdellovibrionia bacterium]
MSSLFFKESKTEVDSLRRSHRYLAAKKELAESILEASSKTHCIKESVSPAARENYLEEIQEFVKDRGRELYFPFLGSGLGSGPFTELVDGSVKFDMITGIGVHFFGHTHPALLEEMIDAVSADVMQGNLQPGIEIKNLLRALLAKVGAGSRLVHGWAMCSGTMVNEAALKMIRQKKAPATKIMAFKDCFAGRSTAMQEITDNPSYRQGQPVYGEVYYLPFYDPKVGLAGSIAATLCEMKELLVRYPGKFAALMIELVQGEGGFQFAPREYYVSIFEEARRSSLAIWADEIQSFGRTGELFAYQKFALNEYMDVVTVGKMLQACVVLYTAEYNPKPGLIAGTFVGSTVALRTARKILELLHVDGYLGKGGIIEKLSNRFVQRLQVLQNGSCSGMILEIRAIGGMIAFAPFDGTMNDVKSLLMRLFDLGVVAFYCGHGPYLIRLLPPLGAMTEEHVDQVCHLIETSLLEEAKLRKK